MKISASIYSNKTKSLEELVKELDSVNVDYMHVDCNDDLKVFDDIKLIRKISKTPVDLHIISSEPEKFYAGIKETGTEFVTFQLENLKSPLNIPTDIKCKLGLAIVSATPIDVFEPYQDKFDFILFMTTTPGKSGGIFNKENFRKIRDFKNKFPGKRIHVDGGVTDEVAFVLRNMGVDSVVSGSYLVNNEGAIGRVLHQLRSDNITSHTRISDFMVTREESPAINTSATFLEALQSIEDYKLGFTNVIDAGGKLLGIVSNADVRKGLIKNIKKLEAISVNDLINTNPFKIKDSSTVSEMLAFIKSIKFPILFLPVVDDNNVLQGIVTFNNLIKGE
ncbi:MAG TPA: CBS domain-containing protein [Bacteroidia bacterium]|nr:CBS domain-containing protein [Bacteroidia bacterium]